MRFCHGETSRCDTTNKAFHLRRTLHQRSHSETEPDVSLGETELFAEALGGAAETAASTKKEKKKKRKAGARSSSGKRSSLSATGAEMRDD